MLLVGVQYEQHKYFSLNDIYENAIKCYSNFITHTPLLK